MADGFAKDYIQVNQRIIAFYAKFPDGSLQSEIVELNDTRVVMRAYAYRSPTDERPGIGYSSLEIPGRTPYTRGSEIENTETSAWGRAIAALGFEVKRGIASQEEVDNKRDDGQSAPRGLVGTREHPVPDLSKTPEGGLIGTAIAQGNHDFNLRQTPDGFALPFRLKNGSTSFIVRAENRLAEALDAIKATVIDQRVTVWGHWQDQTTPAKGTKHAIHYRILVLERIATPDGILPAPAYDSPDGPIPEPREAETAPLFDDEEQAAIDAALEKVG